MTLHYSARDRANEIRIARRFCARYGGDFTFNTVPTGHYDVDWRNPNIDRQAFIEIKKRHSDRSKLSYIICNFEKVWQAIGTKTILLIEWNDAIGHIDIQGWFKLAPYQRKQNARYNDIESLHAFYYTKHFNFF